MGRGAGATGRGPEIAGEMNRVPSLEGLADTGSLDGMGGRDIGGTAAAREIGIGIG